MEAIEELVQQADNLFSRAEACVENAPAESIGLFKQGIGKLFQAYLTLNEEDANGDFGQMAEACQRIDPSFEAVDNELKLFMGNPAEISADDLVDAANEVWDFIIDLLVEEE